MLRWQVQGQEKGRQQLTRRASKVIYVQICIICTYMHSMYCFKAVSYRGFIWHWSWKQEILSLRYWNGYILVYEARPDLHKTPRTPKKSFCGTASRRSVGPSAARRITLPSRISEPGKPATGSDSLVRESLSELSDLLEKGERQGIFSSKIPPLIERGIREDNMKFMQVCVLFVMAVPKNELISLEFRLVATSR